MIDPRILAATKAVEQILSDRPPFMVSPLAIATAAIRAADAATERRPLTADMSDVVQAIRAGGA